MSEQTELKLDGFEGISVGVIAEIPAATRGGGIYEPLLPHIPDAPQALELTFPNVDEASTKVQGFRGFIARRKVKDSYKVRRIDNVVFISHVEGTETGADDEEDAPRDDS